MQAAPSASGCCSHPLSLLSLHASFPNQNQVGSGRLSALVPILLLHSQHPLLFCSGVILFLNPNAAGVRVGLGSLFQIGSHCNPGILQWFLRLRCRSWLSLCTRTPSNGTGGGGNGSICIVGLSTGHLPSTSLHGTPITLLTASLSHLSCCSNLPSPRSSQYTFCRLLEALSTVVSHSQPHSELKYRIHSVQRF